VLTNTGDLQFPRAWRHHYGHRVCAFGADHVGYVRSRLRAHVPDYSARGPSRYKFTGRQRPGVQTGGAPILLIPKAKAACSTNAGATRCSTWARLAADRNSAPWGRNTNAAGKANSNLTGPRRSPLPHNCNRKRNRNCVKAGFQAERDSPDKLLAANSARRGGNGPSFSVSLPAALTAAAVRMHNQNKKTTVAIPKKSHPNKNN
jgi:hypothetical protein